MFFPVDDTHRFPKTPIWVTMRNISSWLYLYQEEIIFFIIWSIQPQATDKEKQIEFQIENQGYLNLFIFALIIDLKCAIVDRGCNFWKRGSHEITLLVQRPRIWAAAQIWLVPFQKILNQIFIFPFLSVYNIV